MVMVNIGGIFHDEKCSVDDVLSRLGIVLQKKHVAQIKIPFKKYRKT